MSDVTNETNTSEPTSTTEPPVSTEVSTTVDSAQSKVDELVEEISRLRRERSSDKEKTDTIIGALQSQIDDLKAYIEKLKKQESKPETKPRQTLVPPPPPPETSQPAKAQTEADVQRKEGIFRRLW